MLGQSPASSACPYTKPSLTSRGRSRSCHLAWTIAGATRPWSRVCFPASPKAGKRVQSSITFHRCPPARATCPTRPRPAVDAGSRPAHAACPSRQRPAVHGAVARAPDVSTTTTSSGVRGTASNPCSDVPCSPAQAPLATEVFTAPWPTAGTSQLVPLHERTAVPHLVQRQPRTLTSGADAPH